MSKNNVSAVKDELGEAAYLQTIDQVACYLSVPHWARAQAMFPPQ